MHAIRDIRLLGGDICLRNICFEDKRAYLMYLFSDKYLKIVKIKKYLMRCIFSLFAIFFVFSVIDMKLASAISFVIILFLATAYGFICFYDEQQFKKCEEKQLKNKIECEKAIQEFKLRNPYFRQFREIEKINNLWRQD